MAGAGVPAVVGTLPKGSPSLGDAAGRDADERLTKELAARRRPQPSFDTSLPPTSCCPTSLLTKPPGCCFIMSTGGLAMRMFTSWPAPTKPPAPPTAASALSVKFPNCGIPTPASWNPWGVYEQSGGTTRIPLQSIPSGSVFVVFRPCAVKPHAISVVQEGKPSSSPGGTSPPLELLSDGKRLPLQTFAAGRFAVKLPDNRTRIVEVASVPAPQAIAVCGRCNSRRAGGAPEHVKLAKLISWPDHPDAGVRYFSGTAIYRTTFDALGIADRSARLFLDLGRVEVIAEVRVNGKPLGTYWKPPFRCDVTDVLRGGRTNSK